MQPEPKCPATPCSFSDVTVPVGAAVAGEACNSGGIPVEDGNQCNITKDDHDCQNVQCNAGSWDFISPNCTLATLKTGVVLNFRTVNDAKPWLKMEVTSGLNADSSKGVGESNKFVLMKASGTSGEEISNGDVVALYSEKTGSFVEVAGTLLAKGTAGEVSSWPTEPAKHFFLETPQPATTRSVIYSDTVYLRSVSTDKYLGRSQDAATQCAVDDIADQYLCQALVTMASNTLLSALASSSNKTCQNQCTETATCDMYTKVLDNAAVETSCTLHQTDNSTTETTSNSGTFGCVKVNAADLPTNCAAGVQKDNANVCNITKSSLSISMKCCNGIWEKDSCVAEGTATNMKAISVAKSIYNMFRLSVDESSEREFANDITTETEVFELELS